MKKYLLLVALIILSLNTAFAQWTNSGPDIGTGKIQQNGNRLYLLSTRLYHSDDNGITWQIENTPAITFNDLLFITSKIIAATDKGIFVSYDNGLSWISHSTGITDSTSGVRDIEQIGSRLIATSTSSIYYSDNNGISWNISNISGSNVRQIVSINNTILVNAFGGVYRSTDSGLTYSFSNSGISGANPNIISLFNYNNMLYCHKTNSVEVYKSPDEGLTWLLNNVGLNGTIGSNLIVVNNYLLLTTASGLFTLSGSSWSLSALDNGSNPRLLYFSNGIYLSSINSISNKILHSIDNGNSWSEISQNPYIANVSNLTISENNMLFGNTGVGLFQFNSLSNLWVRFTPILYDFGGTLLSSLNTQIYCIGYGTGNQYYIGTNGGVWSSSDNGATWVQHHVGLPITNTTAGYKTIKDLYLSGNNIIAATTAGIYSSSDQANTWTQVSSLSCNDLHKYGGYLYATGNGVYRSNDNGLTWTAFAGATSGGPFTYITGAGGKLFTSTDASQTPGNTIYADTLATSFSSLTTNIGGAYGYGDFLFLSKFYINTALSLSNQIDMTDNLPCYYASQALGCIETYLNRNVVYGDNLWLGTTGFSTWYRSIGDFGFPVGLSNSQNEKLEIKPYPNPANEIIYFNNLTKADQIEIFNNLGQLQRINLNIDNNGIDISNLAKGFYIYSITDQQNGRKSTGKFIKE